MKVGFLLLLCLAAGSQASFLDDLKATFHNIGTALTTTVHAVGDQAKVVGTNLLQAATEQGKTLASQALQSLLMGTMSALQKPQTDTDATRRTLESDVWLDHHLKDSAIVQVIDQGKIQLQSSSIYTAGTTNLKRSLAEVFQQGKQLSAAAEMLVQEKMDKLSSLYKESIDNLKALSTQLTNLPATDLIKKVDQVVIAHHLLSDNIQTELVAELTKLYAHALSLHPGQKRGTFTDALSSIGAGLASFFQPHVQAVQQLVSGVGESLKQTVQTFHTSLTTGTHATAIHDSTAALAQHGQNALSALKDAVSDILQQTLTNMQPHIVNILQHGSQALTETLSHQPAAGSPSETVVGNPQ